MSPDALIQALCMALATAVSLLVGCYRWARRAERELEALYADYGLLFEHLAEEREIPASCDRCRVALTRLLAGRRASRALRGVPEESHP